MPFPNDDAYPDSALERAGYDPRFTPIDTLMAAPMGVGLSVSEEMEEYD